MPINRRQFIQLGAQVAAVATAGRFLVTEAFAQSTSAYQSAFAQLDRFAEQYLRDMNAPGMTLVLADRSGVQRVATYGFGDLKSHAPVAGDALFQIGSISKSFIANCVLQLHEEGKLDLHRPVLEYLPWWRIESSFAPITVHHLLSHTAGLPDGGPLFLSDPQARHRAAYAPGENFHYCNAAFEVLGHLLWTIDGRSLAEVLRKRIFEPLGMTRSEPELTFDIVEREVRSYWQRLGDRPYPRQGRLCEAPAIVTSSGAGCIASTAGDMGLYIQMLVNFGKGPQGGLISDESFKLLSTPYIKAEEFGPGSCYGYGIAVDTDGGHRILKHTGGMVSFASSIRVDLDDGLGAFASINSMQGYRPTPVTEYATRLMSARRSSKPLPALPPRDDPARIAKAADYAGIFVRRDGRRLVLVAESERLFVLHDGQKVPVESIEGGFAIRHPDFDRYALIFGRADPRQDASAVVELFWGDDWYTHARYTGPASFELAQEWQAFPGHYRNDDPWVGSLHIIVRKGKLMIDGLVPLEAGNDGLFHLRDEPHSPEWISFHDIVNGKAMRLKFSGGDLWRVMSA